jgi:hypothetical protein
MVTIKKASGGASKDVVNRYILKISKDRRNPLLLALLSSLLYQYRVA